MTAHEAAVHTARLRMELSQSKAEQNEYLKNVELARVLAKRAARKHGNKEANEIEDTPRTTEGRKRPASGNPERDRKRVKEWTDHEGDRVQLDNILSKIF
jgi:ESF2/ABP1 family protein